MSVDLDELTTTDLVDELRRRSDASVICLCVIGDQGKRGYNYYREGDIVVQRGLAESVIDVIRDDTVIGDQDDTD